MSGFRSASDVRAFRAVESDAGRMLRPSTPPSVATVLLCNPVKTDIKPGTLVSALCRVFLFFIFFSFLFSFIPSQFRVLNHFLSFYIRVSFTKRSQNDQTNLRPDRTIPSRAEPFRSMKTTSKPPRQGTNLHMSAVLL